MSAVAIIPARGGSKRIPRKNAAIFSGCHLIEWAIAAAINSECIDEVVVSTDDEEIAAISRAAGASVPFIRKADLADDFTPTIPVICDAIARTPRVDETTLIFCLYPSSVFIQRGVLDEAQRQLRSSDMPFMTSVVEFAHPIQRGMTIDSRGRLSMVDPDAIERRTQDLEPTWHDAGQFYIGKAHHWLSVYSVLQQSEAFRLDRRWVQDIDTPADWDLASSIHALLVEQGRVYSPARSQVTPVSS